jgi:hypothetical protein
MARITQDELFGVVNVIRKITGKDYDLEWAYGRPRLVVAGGSRDVSPRLSTGPLYDWLHAFLAGIEVGMRL